MADTTNCTPCASCGCPALPRVSFDQAVVDLMESIALQESALSHILCAETQKMKAALSMEELTCASCWKSTTPPPTWSTPWRTRAGSEREAGIHRQQPLLPLDGEQHHHRELDVKMRLPARNGAMPVSSSPGRGCLKICMCRKSVLLELLNYRNLCYTI